MDLCARCRARDDGARLSGRRNAPKSFAPTMPLPLLTKALAVGTGSATLTFTAISGAVQIDDVYIDPFKVN